MSLQLTSAPWCLQFFTIGVFGSEEEEFFGKLSDQGIDTFCDIRQRRSVRGKRYAFVNSSRLQERLRAMGISYIYIPALAPTPGIRQLQKNADRLNREQNTSRQTLSRTFRNAYRKKILAHFEVEPFIQTLKNSNARRIALFCVEERPDACHRSLVGQKLEKNGFNLIHL